MPFRFSFWRSLALAALLALASCEGGDQASEQAPALANSGAIAATVDGANIYVTDVIVEAINRGIIQPGETLDPGSDTFYQIREELIERRLMAREAEARKLDQTADARHRLDMARSLVLAGLLAETLREDAVTEEDMRRYYEKNARAMKDSEEFHTRVIVAERREQAIAAKLRVERGEPFIAVARDLSRDAETASEGGDMRWLPLESFPDSIREALPSAQKGALLGPFEWNGQWLIVLVEGRRPRELPSFESMRDRIAAQLLWERVRTEVDRLKSASRIQRMGEEQPAAMGARQGLPAPEGANEEEPALDGPGALAAPAMGEPAQADRQAPSVAGPAVPRLKEQKKPQRDPPLRFGQKREEDPAP